VSPAEKIRELHEFTFRCSLFFSGEAGGAERMRN
jgi:hypothetical protein